VREREERENVCVREREEREREERERERVERERREREREESKLLFYDCVIKILLCRPCSTPPQ
jgi:hypothetical protein